MAKEIYPFLEYILEPDKDKRYKHAKDCGYYDPHDNFLIGESGGFLLNIKPGKFINTHLLHEVADFYRKEGVFTPFRIDSIPHRQFRKREAYRRRNGFSAPCWQNPDGSIEDVWITGGHYNFLNYTRMEMVDESTVIMTNGRATAKKYKDFPNFVDAQYWTWQVMKFAENNGFHLIIDKTRRGGFSYIMASDSANEINLSKHKVVIHVAYDNKYLIKKGGLSDFSIDTLRFYEEKTPFKRGIFSPTKEEFKLGYRLPNGVEASDDWDSSLFSVSAFQNPDCAIGKDAVKIKVEELSTMDNFDAFMTVTEPTMTVGSRITGCLMCWGTATATNMDTFEKNFYAPKNFGFMPFENVWDKDARNEVCGFFKSYAWGLEGELEDGRKGYDKDGNSDLEVGLQIAFKEREKKRKEAKTFSDYINYLGQRAIYPAESFNSTSENIFSSDGLNDWENKLRVDSSYKFYVDGELSIVNGVVSFKSNERIRKENPDKKTYDWIQGVPRKNNEDPHGCTRVWFPPEAEETDLGGGRVVKTIPQGTYVAIYDPVGLEKENKELTNRNSLNAMYVYEMPRELNGYKMKLCAARVGRLDKLEDDDNEFYKLCVWYNCIGTSLVEINRGETVSNFRRWKATKYLAHEPLFVWDASVGEKVGSAYGYSITPQKKVDGLRLLKELLYTVIGKDEFGNDICVYHRIYDYQTILELKKFNATGNFDRVSAHILLGIYCKSVNVDAEKKLQNRQKVVDEDDFMSRPWF